MLPSFASDKNPGKILTGFYVREYHVLFSEAPSEEKEKNRLTPP